jgi:hypothetical protein
MIRTRRATAHDARWLVEACGYFAAETRRPKMLPDDPYECGRLWLDAISNHFVVIAEDGARPVGFLLAWYGLHPFNPKLRAFTSGLWYVTPKYRAGRAGLLLLRAFDAEAEHADVAHFTLMRPTGDDTMRRMGYALIERTFEKWTSAR